MGAKNWVLEGDYKHKAVIMQGGKAVLNVGLMKKLKLDSSTIDQIEVVDEDSQKSMGSAAALCFWVPWASWRPRPRRRRGFMWWRFSSRTGSGPFWNWTTHGSRRSNSRCSEERKNAQGFVPWASFYLKYFM